jgi:hypothetical protein
MVASARPSRRAISAIDRPFMVSVVAGELRRAAPFRDPVEHKNPSLPEQLESQTSAPVEEGFLLVVPRRAGDSGARDLLSWPPVQLGPLLASDGS